MKTKLLTALSALFISAKTFAQDSYFPVVTEVSFFLSDDFMSGIVFWAIILISAILMTLVSTIAGLTLLFSKRSGKKSFYLSTIPILFLQTALILISEGPIFLSIFTIIIAISSIVFFLKQKKTALTLTISTMLIVNILSIFSALEILS